MKRAAFALPILILAGQAFAISTYDIDRMSCSRVQSALKSDGIAQLRYRSKSTGNPIYSRYVHDRTSCGRSQVAERTSVPTADDSSCPVRKCVTKGGQR